MYQNQEQTKKEFIENLEKVPVISVVCDKMTISRATIYRWLEEDDTFYMKKEDVVNDIAESKLISKIQSGDNWAIRYWLENNGKRYRKVDNDSPIKLEEFAKLTLLPPKLKDDKQDDEK
jgi:hypothetical protein